MVCLLAPFVVRAADTAHLTLTLNGDVIQGESDITRLGLFRGPGFVLNAASVSQKRITLSTAPLEKPWQKTQWEIVRATGKFGFKIAEPSVSRI